MLLLSTSILTYCSFYKNKIVFYIELFPYNKKRLIQNSKMDPIQWTLEKGVYLYRIFYVK